VNSLENTHYGKRSFIWGPLQVTTDSGAHRQIPTTPAGFPVCPGSAVAWWWGWDRAG